MRYYFDINTCIVTTVSGVSDTLMRHVTLCLQLVYIKNFVSILLSIFILLLF